MKLTNSFSIILWVVSAVSLLILLPGEVSAAWGWGSSSSSNTAAKEVDEVKEVKMNNNNEDPAVAAAAAAAADVVVASSLPTVVNSRTLESIINNEKRFVLYNSRRLTGECLPICAEDTPTGPKLKTTITPTNSPTLTTKTFPPVSAGQEGTLPPTTGGSTAFVPASSVPGSSVPASSSPGSSVPGSSVPASSSPGSSVPASSSPGSSVPGSSVPASSFSSSPTVAATKKSPPPPTEGPITVGDTEDTNVPTGFPTDFPEVAVDPGTFCRMENSVAWNSDSDCPGTPGSCQMRNPYNGHNSCGPGVPVGFYPDLTRCDAYCKCTGTEAPSEYMIVATGLEWDTHQQGTNYYLDGVWGKGGAWGTNGGGQGRNYEMSLAGRDRPPQCGGGNPCTGTDTQSCDGCTKWHTCLNKVAGPVMDCAPGTLWNKNSGGCDHEYNVKKCKDNPCPQ